MRVLAALVLALALPACAFSARESDETPYGESDPFHDRMAPVNDLYTEHPVVEVPTAIGNVVGWLIVAIPWGVTAVVEDATRDDDRQPVARDIMAGAGYFGGALLGSPFLGLYWAFYRWWRDLVFEPTD